MLQRFIKTFSDVKILHITLPILMGYLIVGTIAQKYIGLYEATQTIFYAPIFWIGIIPLPGMPVFMAILLLNLICYVFAKNPWQKNKLGTLTAHIGIIALLIGGFYTKTFSQSGYIDLAMGQTVSSFSDYNQRHFVIRNLDNNETTTIAYDALKIGTPITDTPFDINVINMCQNCAIAARENGDDSFIGMAQHMQLSDQDLALQNEENMAGVTFSHAGKTYLVLEDVPQYPQINFNDAHYQIELNKAVRDIPFSIQLIGFERDTYPQTNKVRGYKSDIVITDGALQWQDSISMNNPFRYKGHTFYQSSFIASPAGERSVLAVVKNSGRAFPYIAGFAICVGVLLHLLLNYSTALKKKAVK